MKEIGKLEETWTSRTEILIGKEAIKKLEKSKVAIYGIGGVGSFVVEGLVRAGIGHIVLIDNDVVSISNLNRQIHANIQTIGKKKTQVMKERMLKINQNLKVDTFMAQELIQGEESIINDSFSYIVDSVDTVSTKIKLMEKANQAKVPILSCMGTGNKLDPTKFEIVDIEKTSVCPLARVIRKEAKKRNLHGIKVLYSKEEPKQVKNQEIIGSISFVPSVAGLIIAGEVVKDIIA
ncbi:MAG: tRNA threonylcarbamoyladenosine dehydratase [Clostridia bacterium]|nr:tRNA threonylcarbamoyladenosine dehydratase [Clostridia bacterium]